MSFIALLALALVALFALGDPVLAGVFGVLAILSRLQIHRNLGMLLMVGGGLLTVGFFLFGFTLGFLNFFTILALAGGGAVMFFFN